LQKKMSSGNTNVYIYHPVLLFISNQDLMIYTGRVVAGSMEPPSPRQARRQERGAALRLASPRTSNVVFLSALSLVSTLAFVVNNTRMLHN